MTYPTLQTQQETATLTTYLGGWLIPLLEAPKANVVICDYFDTCRKTGCTPYWSVVTTMLEEAGITIIAKRCIK